MKQKKKKYANGTGIKNYIESPDTALAKNDIALAKAKQKAMDNPWTQGLDMIGNLALNYGTSMMGSGIASGEGVSDSGVEWGKLLQQGVQGAGAYGNASSQGVFALGGQAEGEIEAEGGEVVQTQDGQVSELKGPKHEQGGIDLDVPSGTDIFSDRIYVKGKSMADRKKARENRLAKIEKSMGGKADKVGRDTYTRTKEALDLEEQGDLRLQETINFIAGSHGEAMYGLNSEPGLPEILSMMMLAANTSGQEYRGAKTSDPKAIMQEQMDAHLLDGKRQKPQVAKYGTGTKKKYVYGTEKGVNELTPQGYDLPDPLDFIEIGDINTSANAPVSSQKSSFAGILNSLAGEGTNTNGNMVKQIGNIFSATAPMKNTLANRAGDTPNINAYKDFGADALGIINDSKGYIAGQKDKALQDVSRGNSAAKRRSRNSARGVNTQRALDLSSDLASNQAKENIYDNFSKQMMQILGQEAGFEMQQDQVVMGGEQARDLADRQDRDAFYTQMAQNISTKGQGIQQIGSDMNDVKQQETIKKLLNQLSKYGITFDGNNNLQNPK